MSEKSHIKRNSLNDHSRHRSGRSSSFLKPPLFIQPKLAINRPNDIYEQEANEMANDSMRMKQPIYHKTFFAPVPKYIPQTTNIISKSEKIIQRQSKDEEPPPQPVFKPMIEWDDGKKINLLPLSDLKFSNDDQRGSVSDPLVSGGSLPPLPNFREARLRLIGKRVLFLDDYIGDFGNLWQDTFQLVVDWRLGHIVENALDKVPSALSFIKPDLEGLDMDHYLTNKLVLEALGSTNTREYPEFNEGSGFTFTIPLVKKRF